MLFYRAVRQNLTGNSCGIEHLGARAYPLATIAASSNRGTSAQKLVLPPSHLD